MRTAILIQPQAARRAHQNLDQYRRSPENAERLRQIMQDPEHRRYMSELAKDPRVAAAVASVS